jgi:large subunit ribosomal protein L16
MGRGKGNVDHWVCYIKPGRILFEVKSKTRESIPLHSVLNFSLRKLPFPAQVINKFPLLEQSKG